MESGIKPRHHNTIKITGPLKPGPSPSSNINLVLSAPYLASPTDK